MTQPHLQLDLSPDQTQLGKYRLVATLGQGGMGTVYLALASGLGSFRKLLVVKELRRDLPWKESSLAMFMDEAHLAARLEHPNVLHTFEAGEDHGRYFLAMEYLDGQPLSALIERARTAGDKQGLPLELQIHMLCEVLNGLQYAHDLKDYDGSLLHVVHRDISPQNVFITYHGEVKVVDFGVAKANNASSLTSPGVFKGKFAYAAPEQLLGRPVDGRSDVFAVGVMLWEAIVGRRFGDAVPTPASFRTRTSGLEPRVTQAAPDVDPLLAEICDRAIAVDLEQRFTSAEAFRRELQEYLLLQGERIESEQIASVMRRLFQREREAIHQVIERTMADAGASRSVIQELAVDMGAMSKREITNRADLSDSIDITHENEELRQRASFIQRKAASIAPELTQVNRRPEPPPWASAAILLGLAVAVFVATYQLSRTVSEPADPSPRTVEAPQPTAAPMPSPSAKVLTHTVQETAPSAPPSERIEPPPPPPPNALEAAPSTPSNEAASAKPSPAAPAAHTRSEEEEASAEALKRAQPAAKPKHDQAPIAAPAPAPRAEPRPAPAPKRSADSSSASTPRENRGGPRVHIDTEDPYQ
jgi:hypothetical protein